MTDVLLLDAGVWVATIISDERFELASRELLADASRTIGSLDLTLYEVANAVGSKRGKLGTAVSICRTVERRCRQTMVHIDGGLIESTIEVASAHGLTAYDAAYDAAYVAVARRHDWTLVSTDIRDLVSKGLAITPDAAV